MDADDLGGGTLGKKVVAHHLQAHVLVVVSDEGERYAIGVFLERRGDVEARGEIRLAHSFDLVE